MMNSKTSFLRFLLASSLIVSLTACSTVSENFALKPAVNIPDLPASVRYTDPSIPAKAAKDASDVAKALTVYEMANESNRKAIAAAKSHNKGLQRIYNKKQEKAPATSSWVSGTWSNPFPNFWNVKPF